MFKKNHKNFPLVTFKTIVCVSEFSLRVKAVCSFFFQCTESVNKAFQQVDGLIADRQFSKLKQDFNSCDDISNVNDTAMFVSNLAGTFEGVVQYNNQMFGLNISVLCSKMTRTGFSPYDNLGLSSKR